MAGHMGDKIRTIQNLEIIKSDIENNLIFIKGSIPGSKNAFVLIKKNSKNIKRISTLERSSKIQKESGKVATDKKKKSEVKAETKKDLTKKRR